MGLPTHNHKRRKRQWVLILGAIILLLAGTSYLFTVVRPDLGAQAIDLLRLVAGDQAAAWLETTVYQAQDTLARARYAAGGAPPVAPWEVTTTAPLDQPTALPVGHQAPTSVEPVGSVRTPLAPAVRSHPPVSASSHPPDQPIAPPPAAQETSWPPRPLPARTNLAGEGQWSPYIRNTTGRVVAYRTFLQPDPQRPDVTVAIVAFDTASTQLHFVLGSEEPASPVRIPRTGMIPIADRQPGILIAAFNGGFKVRHGHFGAAVDGTVVLPPRIGIGTIAMYADGRAHIGAWGTDIIPAEDLHTWRQNGPLVMQHGVINPHIDENIPEDWGVILNGVTAVWRSGLGLSADERVLYYVAGLRMTLPVLADALATAGADQAVQLDINTTNVHFDAIEATADGLQAKPLFDAMKNQHDHRFLDGDTRDYFYITANP